MTTFSENPYSKARKAINGLLFKKGLDTTLDKKFKHKSFSERFAMANAAFLGIGFIAQFASLTTAFTMLSFLFVSVHIIARVICATALVIALEVIKREASNDVMKGVFQYRGEVEPFPAVLLLLTIGSSIYISVEGAKLMPSLFIADAIKEQPILESSEPIVLDFDNRIKAIEAQRDEYRKNRLYKGKLASKDSKVIDKYNEDIKAQLSQKDNALAALAQSNKNQSQNAASNYQNKIQEVNQERTELSNTLVMAAIAFEVLFLLAMCFSWWYYTECMKEKETSKVTAETPTNTGVTSKVTNETLEVETLEVEGNVRSRKPSFVDYEDIGNKEVIEVKEVEYTRICPECNTPFIHKTHNHTYCKRSCMLLARDKEQAKNC